MAQQEAREKINIKPQLLPSVKLPLK